MVQWLGISECGFQRGRIGVDWQREHVSRGIARSY